MGNSISTLGQALDQISRLKTQQRTMDLLSQQMATGKKTQVFSGLGKDVMASTRSRASINAFEAYIQNIKNTDRRINLMSNSLDQIRDQVDLTLDAMQISLQNGSYEDLPVIQEQAENIYKYVIELINSKDGERYLFSGADSTTAPISDMGMLTNFLGEFVPDEADLNNPPLIASGTIGQWGDGTITTAEFIQSYKNINETVLGYSSTLSSGNAGKISTRINETSEIDYTVLGNSEALKEILSALAVIKSLPPVEYAPGALNDPTASTLPEDIPPYPPAQKQENFFAVINDLAAMLDGAVKKLDNESFKLANVQARLNIVKESHTQEINTLANIVSDVEDVDVTEVAAKITQLQVQLEASYNVTAITANLSLVNFLN